METYSKFRPTAFDQAGAFLDDDRQYWLVGPCSVTRDSGPFEESNWESMLSLLRDLGDDAALEDWEIHRFGHWGPGWFEIVIARPDSVAARLLADLECALADYPVIDDTDLSEREQEEADRVWRDCYNVRERINYIAEYRSQFDFRSFSDMLSCVRGNYFAGYASELIA
jgi:hypothetical protein